MRTLLIALDRLMFRHCVLSLALLICMPGIGFAAQIGSSQASGDGFAVITIQGEIASEDANQFKEIASRFQEALVVFESPGGSLIAGIEIGTAIRLRNFGTAVLDRKQCASACAIAWLGGT